MSIFTNHQKYSHHLFDLAGGLKGMIPVLPIVHDLLAE
jgi:hypothetical protein